MYEGWLWLSILKTTAWPSPMSITPAFSPGPWITQGALVGSPRRWMREDLYEQCSFHIAEKIPSSVKLGGRPRSFRIRSYSSGLSPCSAISSGVMAGSFEVTAVSDWASASRRYLEMIDQPREQTTAVGPPHRGFDVIFRMRHHPEHILAVIDDTGDAVHRAVVIPVRINYAVGRRIAEQHPALALEPRDGLPVGNVVAFAVRHWDPDHLPGIIAARERRVGAFDPQTDVAADEAKLGIAHQYARQQSRFAGDLEAVAYCQHQSAFGGEITHGIHNRRAGGNRAAAQVIAVGKAAGKNHEIGARWQRRVGMPDQSRVVPRDQPQRPRHVALAVDSGEDDDSRSHRSR